MADLPATGRISNFTAFQNGLRAGSTEALGRSRMALLRAAGTKAVKPLAKGIAANYPLQRSVGFRLGRCFAAPSVE
ncbi:MAG TPA: hypothetical protein VFH89_03495 [Sphingomicrobium sp.]|nr:hypothetical protein [Sphingomicrobium sp.]